MNNTDIYFLISVLAVLLSLLRKNDGRWSIVSAIILTFGAWQTGENYLRISCVMGFEIALLQALVADPELVKHTLKYAESRIKIRVTPWWMIILWYVATAQLNYLWIRIDAVIMYFNITADFAIAIFAIKYVIFISIGNLYFLSFELIVNNFTYWWERRNCNQFLNVAYYAVVAEFKTVAILPPLVSIALFLGIEWSFITGVIAALFIASFFVNTCKRYYLAAERI